MEIFNHTWCGAISGTMLALLAHAGFLSAQIPATQRLDLFDAQDNHLMFVVFENNNDGKTVSRSVYMSDSTFIRKTLVHYDAKGDRANEISLNFNDDTIYSTTLSSNGDSKSMSIRDQFGLDQFGGAVSYRSTGTDNFIISQSNSDINKMTYDTDAHGNTEKITVSDVAGTTLYYGTFSNVGTVIPAPRKKPSISRITMHGNNHLTIQFAVNRQAQVQCELIDLNGRRSGVLFREECSMGTHRKNISLVSPSSLRNADGVYLVLLSIDGIIEARSRHLLIRSGGGGL